MDQSATQNGLLAPPPDAYFSEEDLQKWALETNGEPFSDETKEEVIEFFDVTDDNNLTYVAKTLFNYRMLKLYCLVSKDSCNYNSFKLKMRKRKHGRTW